ncbi:MAG: hypothetical protein JWM41_3819 [Gemmatimonadetes bacterium]|nr:hypothetical protein [Gemmatimonadota bacterium]
MRPPKYVQNVLLGVTAVALVGTHFVPSANQSGPVLTAATTLVIGKPKPSDPVTTSTSTLASNVQAALGALSGAVAQLSHPKALDDAFRSYFAYKTAHPNDVKKPYLYFVDYGLPSTTPRGYVFDMNSLKIVEGPFTVAHGRGSSTSQYGVPTKFSNTPNSAATSLGLYLTQATYDFHGHTGGQPYSSIGLRLQGVSDGFNTNALARRVVAHGAPYVTPTRAGRSEGCPAMEPARAKELLPKLAGGAMVFLFAPDKGWMAGDPWVGAAE